MKLPAPWMRRPLWPVAAIGGTLGALAVVRDSRPAGEQFSDVNLWRDLVPACEGGVAGAVLFVVLGYVLGLRGKPGPRWR